MLAHLAWITTSGGRMCGKKEQSNKKVESRNSGKVCNEYALLKYFQTNIALFESVLFPIAIFKI